MRVGARERCLAGATTFGDAVSRPRPRARHGQTQGAGAFWAQEPPARVGGKGVLVRMEGGASWRSRYACTGRTDPS